jgi:hypothetical protein
MKSIALQQTSRGLHISYSQIFTYLSCSLKYRFRYVLRRAPEKNRCRITVRLCDAQSPGALLP